MLHDAWEQNNTFYVETELQQGREWNVYLYYEYFENLIYFFWGYFFVYIKLFIIKFHYIS